MYVIHENKDKMLIINAITPLFLIIFLQFYLKKNFKLNLQFGNSFRTIIKEIYKK